MRIWIVEYNRWDERYIDSVHLSKRLAKRHRKRIAGKNFKKYYSVRRVFGLEKIRKEYNEFLAQSAKYIQSQP